MSLFDIVRALRRHILVVLFLLVASGFAAYEVYSQVPVYYQSDATMVVLLPSVVGVDEELVQVNPWTNLGAQSSQVAASALASIAGSEDFRQSLADLGVTSEVTVQVAPTYGGGVVLSLSAVSLEAPAAQNDLILVSARVSAALQEQQLAASAPKGTLLTVGDLTSATTPAPLATSGIKVAAVTVGIGLVVIAVVVLLLEALRRGSPRPKAPAKPPASASALSSSSASSSDVLLEQDEWLDADLWADSKPLVSQPS